MKNREDAEKLFHENEKLIWLVLKKDFPYSYHDPDAYQCGALGLWKACMNFDESKGVKFSTYAYYAIAKTIASTFIRPKTKKSAIPNVVSLDSMLRNDSENDSDVAFINNVIDDSYNSVVCFFDNDIFNDKEKQILKYRQQGLSIREIGELTGMSHEWVRQILLKMKNKVLDSVIVL